MEIQWNKFSSGSTRVHNYLLWEYNETNLTGGAREYITIYYGNTMKQIVEPKFDAVVVCVFAPPPPLLESNYVSLI